MALDIFDLTEFTQLAIRKDTGLHDGLSLHIYTSNDEWLSEHIERLKAEGHDVPPIHSTSDAVEWSRAVRMAKWILEADERYNANMGENGKLARATEAPKIIEIKEEDVKEILEAIRTAPRVWGTIEIDDGRAEE